MKLIKGMLIGGAATVGALMMYNGMSDKRRKQMMKKGRQIMKNMGII